MMQREMQILGESKSSQKYLMYAEDGLAKVRQRFGSLTKLPQAIKVPAELVESFKTAKQLNPSNEKLTAYYNISVLIQWTISDIKEHNPRFLRIDSSELCVVLLLMSMMEKNILLKALETKEIKEVNEYLEYVIKLKLKDVNKVCSDYSERIKDSTCRLISQNTISSMQNLLRKKESIIKEDKPIPPLTEIDLSCIFSNILLNLRRTIRKITSQQSPEITPFLRELNCIELKSYYLSLATFTGTEKYLQELSGDVFNHHRKTTYAYLIYDERGIYKLNKYFQQAPLNLFQNDMRLVSKMINKQSQLISKESY